MNVERTSVGWGMEGEGFLGCADRLAVAFGRKFFCGVRRVCCRLVVDSLVAVAMRFDGGRHFGGKRLGVPIM